MEPANPVDTPNPSKAPWYFLGLQEMLVYYDPWMAGVVLPTFLPTVVGPSLAQLQSSARATKYQSA
mgnify:CR=1 FL=1